MTIRIEAIRDDDPALRRLLMQELAPMLALCADAAPTWICVAAQAGGAPEGGLIGLVTGAWVSIDLIWLPPSLRRQGLGSGLLAVAEREARALGCLGAHVGTTSAAACAFYAQNGYEMRLAMPEIAPGVTQTILQKFFEEQLPADTSQPMSRTKAGRFP